MKKELRHIEIVSTSNKSLSSMSEASRQGVYDVLSELYTDVRITLTDTIEDLQNLVLRKPDLVFLGMKYMTVGSPSQLSEIKRVWLAEYLDMHGIAYTGSNKDAHVLELHKPSAKQKILDSGLITSSYSVVRKDTEFEDTTNLQYPIFVKPTEGGGGVGVDKFSITNNDSELQSKITSISKKYSSDSLLENYLTGREFSVAILKNAHSLGYKVMPIEIVTQPDQDGDRILSSAVKHQNDEEVTIVADYRLNTALKQLAMESFFALGARDYGRIDIRLDENGVPHFLEANLLPSLTKDFGNFPKACLLIAELEYKKAIFLITELGLARARKAI